MNRLRLRRAFTVVEMVIVIAVIAILATVMIPTVSGVIQKANVSADQQFAASLNIQLALWEVDNGEIANESDLREAVNSYYGDNYYETLGPKSGKHDYHFWYDVANKQVLVGKYTELLSEDAVPMLLANDEEDTPTGYNPRKITTDTGTYLLMDRKGSNASNALFNIETASGTAYAQWMGTLKTMMTEGTETELCTVLWNNLNATALANDSGIFANVSNAVNLYIPVTTSKLNGTIYGPEGTSLSNISYVELPSGVIVAEGSLADLGDEAVIVTTITRDTVTTVFMTDSASCWIQLANGEKVKRDDESFEDTYSQTLSSFDVNMTSVDDSKAVFNKDNNTLYVAKDYNGKINLYAEKFTDTDGQPINNASVKWSVGGEPFSGISCEFVPDDGAEISVKVQDKEYTYTVKHVYVTSIQINGDDSEGDGDSYVALLNKEYKSGYTWDFDSMVTVNLNVSGTGVNVDESFAVSLSDSTNVAYDAETGKLGVTDAAAEKDSFTVTITVKNGESITRTCKATFTQSDSVFEIASNANRTNYHVGTASTIQLGTLFALDGTLDTDQNITVEFRLNGSVVGTPSTFTANNSWDTQTITPQTGCNQISIRNGGKATTLDVIVKNGAYNVATPDEWKAVADGNSIVLLKDITLPDVEISAMSKGAGYYSKNIGGASIYGNLHKISFGKFLIKVKGNNYFLRMGNGSYLYDLVIDGPAYGTRQATTGTGGYYVSGVETTSTSTISNCYISGFRSPIYVQGKTVINNSVLNGGAFANIYIHATNTVEFTNVETYQGVHSGAKIGAGILIDNSAGGSSPASTNATITVAGTNGLKQYNFYTKDQIKEIANSLATGAGTAAQFNKFYDLLSDGYYHAGILTWNEDKNYSSTVNSGNGVNGYTFAPYENNFLVYRHIGLYGRGSNCPTRVTGYSIDSNFLAGRTITNTNPA